MHAEDAGIAAAWLDSANAAKSGAHRIRFRHANGRIRILKVTFTRSIGSAGEGVFEVHLQDVRNLCKKLDSGNLTAQKKAAAANILGAFVCCKDPNHVITWANERFSEAFPSLTSKGFGLAGLTDYDLLPEASADLLYGLEEEIFAGIDSPHGLAEIEFGERPVFRRGRLDCRKRQPR